MTSDKKVSIFSLPVIVAALGYFVDIYDLLLLSDLLLFGNTPSDSQLFYSDLDMNGTLDIMDIILLTNKILNF